MTKENREKAYKHFRDIENNYEPLEHLNKGPTEKSLVRKKAKESADAILAKHPELAKGKKEEKKVEEEKKEETKSEEEK